MGFYPFVKMIFYKFSMLSTIIIDMVKSKHV